MNELEEAIALLEAPLIWSADLEHIREALIEVLYAANQRVDHDAETLLANRLLETDDAKA